MGESVWNIPTPCKRESLERQNCAAWGFALLPAAMDAARHKQDVGARLLQAREALGMTQAALARALGEPRDKLSSYELGSLDLVGARKDLPDTSLLSMLLERPVEAIAFVDATELAPSAAAQAAAAPYSPLPRPIRFAVSPDGNRVVFDGGPSLKGKSAALIAALFEAYRDGRTSDTGLSGFRFTAATTLAAVLKMDEASLRQRVRRLRTKLAVEFQSHLNATIGDEEVVETKGWSGYRLNPALFHSPELLQTPAMLVDPAIVTTLRPDVTTHQVTPTIPRASARKMSQLSKR